MLKGDDEMKIQEIRDCFERLVMPSESLTQLAAAGNQEAGRRLQAEVEACRDAHRMLWTKINDLRGVAGFDRNE